MQRKTYRSTRAFGFIVGVPFLAWCVWKIPRAVRADWHNFRPAFREAPILTVGFTALKIWAYVFFPFVAAIWIYISVRDVFPKRRIGTLRSVAQAPTMSESAWLYSVPLVRWFLSWAIPLRSPRVRICLGGHDFVVLDPPGFGAVVNQDDLTGKQIAITCGAFGRVLSVELLEH